MVHSRACINRGGRGVRIRECSSVRDWVADWNKWSRGERVLAIVVTLVLAALPLSLAIAGGAGG
jgi:hypothetical protein